MELAQNILNKNDSIDGSKFITDSVIQDVYFNSNDLLVEDNMDAEINKMLRVNINYFLELSNKIDE